MAALTVGVVDPASGFVDGDDSVTLPAGYVADNVDPRVRRHHPRGPGRHPVRVPRPDRRARQRQQRLRGPQPRPRSQPGPCRQRDRGQPGQPADSAGSGGGTGPHPQPGRTRRRPIRGRSPATPPSSRPRACAPCSRSGRTSTANTPNRPGGTGSPPAPTGPSRARVTTAPAWPTLAARLHTIEAAGGDPEAALNAAIAERPLTGVADVAAVLHHRLGTSSGVRAKPIPACTSRSPSDHRETARTCRPCGRWPPASTSGSANWGSGPPRSPPEWAGPLGPVPTDTVGPSRVDRPGRHRRLLPGSLLDRRIRPDRRRPASRPPRGSTLVARSPDRPDRNPASGGMGQRRRPGPARRCRRPGRERTDRRWLISPAQPKANDTCRPSWSTPPKTSGEPASTQVPVQNRWRPPGNGSRPPRRFSEKPKRTCGPPKSATTPTGSGTPAPRRQGPTPKPPGGSWFGETHPRTPSPASPSSRPAGWRTSRCRPTATWPRKGRALDSAREAVRRLTHRIQRHTEAGETSQADKLRDPLQRNQADMARLEQEVKAATEDAAKYNDELAARPDGQQAKSRRFPRAQPWRGSTVPPDQRTAPTPSPRQRPPSPHTERPRAVAGSRRHDHPHCVRQRAGRVVENRRQVTGLSLSMRTGPRPYPRYQGKWRCHGLRNPAEGH